MIRVRNLSFKYHKSGKYIFKNIDFDIFDNECVVILGKNGAGKSTLIKCLCGLLKAKEGTIYIDNKNIDDFKKGELAKEFAYVNQISEGSDLDVFNTILLGRLHYFNIYPNKIDYEIVNEKIKEYDLKNIAHKSINNLSGGERQKVMIVKAIVQDAKHIIFDEPTSNLDIRNQINVISYINKIKENKSVIVTMHDINLALDIGTKFILLKDGEIFKIGDDSIINEENLKEVFGINFNIYENKKGKHVHYEK